VIRLYEAYVRAATRLGRRDGPAAARGKQPEPRDRGRGGKVAQRPYVTKSAAGPKIQPAQDSHHPVGEQSHQVGEQSRQVGEPSRDLSEQHERA
jgi:hypothetical protein